MTELRGEPGPFGRGTGFPLRKGGKVASRPAAEGEEVTYVFQCPDCGVWSPIATAQLDGHEPIDCPWCPYLATRDLWSEVRAPFPRD